MAKLVENLKNLTEKKGWSGNLGFRMGRKLDFSKNTSSTRFSTKTRNRQKMTTTLKNLTEKKDGKETLGSRW